MEDKNQSENVPAVKKEECSKVEIHGRYPTLASFARRFINIYQYIKRANFSSSSSPLSSRSSLARPSVGQFNRSSESKAKFDQVQCLVTISNSIDFSSVSSSYYYYSFYVLLSLSTFFRATNAARNRISTDNCFLFVYIYICLCVYRILKPLYNDKLEMKPFPKR